MRKILFTVLAAFILLVMGCDDGGMGETNPFVGTWENAISGNVFTDTYNTCYMVADNEPVHSGTYTCDDTYIYLTTDYRIPSMEISEIYPQPLVYQYSFPDENTLIIGVTEFTKVTN
jgi:hypothetical protein